MNNSINRKINVAKKINFQNDLSSTSSDFLSDYNKKYIKQKGGNCSCSTMFKAISNDNLELILYILKENTCCFICKNTYGNTVLHELVPLYSKDDEIKEAFDQLLKNDCSNFINIQNKQGQTPILLAVMNEENELAEKLENAGANGRIEDVNGNFVESKEESVESLEQTNGLMSASEFSYDSETLKKSSQNIINVLNIFLESPSEPDLSSLNLTDDLDDEKNSLKGNSDKVDNSLNTDEFMRVIKDKIDGSIGNKDKSSSSSSTSDEYVKFPEVESSDNTSTINTDKFIALLDNGKPAGIVKYSDNLDNNLDTDEFITLLRRKYDNTDNLDSTKSTVAKKPNTNNNKQVESKPDDETSDMESSVNTQMIKLENETTSDDVVPQVDTSLPVKEISSGDLNKLINETTSENETDMDISKSKLSSKYNVFQKKLGSNNLLNQKNITSSDIDTNTLLKAINKVQLKYNDSYNSDSQVMLGGGVGINKQKLMGFRKLNPDSDNLGLSKKNSYKSSKKSNVSIDYNLLYNSDSEHGTKSKSKSKSKSIDTNNELSRMMVSQKDKLHEEVLNMIMEMLNKGLLTQSNKPIEATERNAKLIKAHIYKQISEKNPQMGGMDKILAIKTMSENEFINMVKKMPNLDELEQSIQKHLEEKRKDKGENKSNDVSDTTESESESDKSEQKSKKKSSKSKSK